MEPPLFQPRGLSIRSPIRKRLCQPSAPNPKRREFYERIGRHDLAPLWEVLDTLVTKTPVTPCVPALWKYREVRPYLMESGELISAEEAERRVLVLENPGMRGASCITHSLYAGLQLIMPARCMPTTVTSIPLCVRGRRQWRVQRRSTASASPASRAIHHHPPWTWHITQSRNEPLCGYGLDVPMAASSTRLHGAVPEERSLVTRPEATRRRVTGQLLPCWNTRSSRSPRDFLLFYPHTRRALKISANGGDSHPCRIKLH